MSTSNYFSVRRYPARSCLVSREQDEIPEDAAWKAARIMSRPPTGAAVASHFFFDLDPRAAWALAMIAAGGDWEKVLVWAQPVMIGPWSRCGVITDTPNHHESSQAAE